MKFKLVIRAVTIAGLLGMLAAPAMAGTPIRLSFRDTTIASGNVLSYAIYVDSSLTGFAVTSYQLQFTYNNSYFKYIGATSAGTIASTWGAPTAKEVSPGTVNIASAGSDSLAGTGKLVILNFTSNLFTSIYNYNEYGYFTFQPAQTYFNQGDSTLSFRNGTVTLTPGPSIAISPNSALLTKGDVQAFGVTGGKLPYRWSTTNPTVASIDTSTGSLTALGAGITKVVVRDSSGYLDTSGTVEVRAYKLSFRDTSCYQGQIIDIPVYCTDLTGLGITSGQFQVTYDQNRWTPLQLVLTSGILASASYSTPSFSAVNGVASISFAGSSPLSGSGVLFFIRMKASTQNYGYTTASFQNGLFNQDLVANASSGTLTVQALATLTVNPSYSQTMVVGDSIQYTASGGIPPYTWSVGGTGSGTISSTGLFKPTGSGIDTVKAVDTFGGSGKGGPISIYDFRLNVPDSAIAPTSYFEVPLMVTSNSAGFQSYDLVLRYTTSTYIRIDSVEFPGTLSNGMTFASAFHGDTIAISAAGVNKIFSSGTLLKLRFRIPDSTSRPSTFYVNVQSVRFDEGIPLALPKNGTYQIINGPIFGLSAPRTAFSSTVGHTDSTVFTVYNPGTTALTSSISVLSSTEFSVSPTSINVLPADSAKISVYFQPTVDGPVNATIRFSNNDSYHPTVDVPVSGVTPYPILAFSATSINFGTVNVGQYKDTTVTISNTGTDSLRISNIAGSLAIFSARPTSVTIAPGHSFVDTLRFTPAAGGVVSGRFSFTSNSLTSPDTVGALGNGNAIVPILSLSASAVSFGGVKINAFKDTIVTISNTGADTLKISGITTSNSVFSARPTTRTVPPGQSFSDTLRFAPTLTGGYTGRIFIASNAPSSPDTISVSGTGNPATDVAGPSAIPDDYSMDQNYPNPFNPSTIIRYGLRSRSTVRLSIYNILGQRVDELVNGEQGGGIHAVTWNPSSAPSGVYFYRIDATSLENPTDHFSQIRKMILMK